MPTRLPDFPLRPAGPAATGFLSRGLGGYHDAARWVLALHGGRLQPLGGWLPASLRLALAGSSARSLVALAESLPHLAVPAEGPEWLDADTPEERQTFERE